MDPLGNVVRNLMREKRATIVRSASAVAMEFAKQGMTKDQMEEMLFSSGFEADVVEEVLTSTPIKKR